MNKVFNFLDYDTLYKRCVLSSVIHAIMVGGEYGVFPAEQSWERKNYSFQNLAGVRGTISFADDRYICVIQNNTMYETYTNQYMLELLHGAEEKTIDLANKEALQYVLDEFNGEVIPFVSAAFWGNKDINYSNLSEDQIVKISDEAILPLLYSEDDTKEFWKESYEMTNEQMKLAEEIYKRRLGIKGKIILQPNEISKLKEWFGNIDECVESFQELDIYLN